MTAPTNRLDGAMTMTDERITEAEVIETCEVHGFPLDPDQLEVVTAVVNQILLSASKPAVVQCVHVNEPKACYRVRCQLGNKCVDDDMSPRVEISNRSTAICLFCNQPIDGAHETDCPQADPVAIPDRHAILYEAGEALLAANHCEAYEVLYRMMEECRAASPAAPAQSADDDMPPPLKDSQRSHAVSFYMSLPHNMDSAEAIITKVAADAYVNGFQAGKHCAAPAQSGEPISLEQVKALESAVCEGRNGEALRLLHHIRNALAAPQPAQTAQSASAHNRPETTSEHIARDIREGRFPQRSEPQTVTDTAPSAVVLDDERAGDAK